RIAKPDEALTIGQEVEAMIIDINDDKKKVSLSVRAAMNGGADEDAE
ncbi:MAG: S1 RNA-binding domain-containing protein, partial [Clostridia bacterium]|nr:S1 RNA-binding domain-containing protein [Clostridia bacterium]